MTEAERKRDSYLRRVYGRNLKWYNKRLKKQKGKCGICRRPPKNLPLAVDHWHKLARCKVISKKDGKLWKAYNIEFNQLGYHLDEAALTFRSHNRRKAIKMVKRLLQQKSNRGLLCWHCNTGLKKWNDRPNELVAAAKYLKEHQKGSV